MFNVFVCNRQLFACSTSIPKDQHFQELFVHRSTTRTVNQSKVIWTNKKQRTDRSKPPFIILSPHLFLSWSPLFLRRRLFLRGSTRVVDSRTFLPCFRRSIHGLWSRWRIRGAELGSIGEVGEIISAGEELIGRREDLRGLASVSRHCWYCNVFRTDTESLVLERERVKSFSGLTLFFL